MRLILLGSPSLHTGDGRPVAFDTRKATAILAYLALYDEPFQRDTFATLFWPELDQSRARAALRRTLTPINRALGDDALIATRETVALNPGYRLWVDARAFEAAANGLPEIQNLENALDLYKGDFMAGFTLRDAPEFDNWQYFETDRLRRLYASTLDRVIPLLVARGDLDPAINHAHKWLALDQLHEPAHRALMRLYAQSGQRAAALRQYRECVRILEEELGVPPLEETRELYEEILEARGERERRSEGEKERPLFTSAPLPPVTPASSSRAPLLPNFPAPFPLTGRQVEFDGLATAYNRISPDGHFIGIVGEAGVGKTRLAEEFLSQIQLTGAITLTGRCYRGEEQLAYGLVVEGIRSILGRPDINARLSQIPAHWQSELTRLLPELPFQQSSSTHPQPGTQTRLFESLRQFLYTVTAGHQPAVLFFDDLQWADSATLDLIMYIIHRLQDYPVLMIANWRNEGDLDRLEGLMAESLRSGYGTKIQLARLTRGEVSQLTAGLDRIPPDRLHFLFDETEGLPFFVVEFLSAAQQGKDWNTLHSVQELERARLLGLDETARQVLTTAAVIGRSFEFDTLRETSGRSEEETIAGLESLIARGLLVERMTDERPISYTPKYDFTHEKIRTVVYGDTSLARRRLLHRRVAEVLLPRMRNSGENAARIAFHYQRAGQESEAAAFFFQAGNYARDLFANTESLSHYQTALALGYPEPASLHEAIGELQTLQGDYRSAVTSFEKAAALSEFEHLSQIEHKLANLHHRRGDDDLADSYFQSAFEKLPERNQSALQAQILADWSRTCARINDPIRARQLAEEALALSNRSSDLPSAGQAFNVLGMLARQAGDLVQAADHLQQALITANKISHFPSEIAALNNLALVYEDQGNFDQAIELAQAALDLCARLGDRHREAALRNRLADLFHASNQPSAAMYHLKKAVEIFAEIGGEAGAYEPEIWKLTEW